VWIDRVVQPFLTPIRRYVPTVGMLDFSPMVLILLAQLIGIILRSILISLV
jgi:YggT family protein